MKDWIIKCDNQLKIKEIGRNIQAIHPNKEDEFLYEYLTIDKDSLIEQIAQNEEISIQEDLFDFNLICISESEAKELSFFVIPSSVDQSKKLRNFMHDIKNPLTNIILSTELLKSGDLTDGNIKLLSVIDQNTTRIKTILSDYPSYMR